MTKSATTGAKLLKDIQKLAIESPFQTSQLVQDAKQVMAFGFEVQDVIPVLSRLGDVGVATGADMGRLILALGQVRTTGRLMGQELRQFTNAGVPILEYLAKVLNTTSAQVPNLVRQGKISFADVANAINMMTDSGGLFYGMMQRINKETVSGRWANFKESVQLTGMALGGTFFEAFRVKEVLSDLTNNLKLVSENQAFEFFAGARIALYSMYQGILQIIQVVREWVYRNRELVIQIVAVIVLMKAFTTAIYIVTTAWGILSAAIYFFATPIGVVSIAIVALVVALEKLGMFAGIGSRLVEGFRELAPVFTEAWKGIVDAVKGNDMELAFNIMMTAIREAWHFMLNLMEIEWMRFTNHLTNKAGGGLLDFVEKTQVRLNTFSIIGDLGVSVPGFSGKEESDKLMAQRFQRMQMIDKRAAMLEAANNQLTDESTKKVLGEALSKLAAAKEELKLLGKVAEFRSAFPLGTRAGEVAATIPNPQRMGNGTLFPAFPPTSQIESPNNALSALTGAAAVQGNYVQLFQEARSQLSAYRHLLHSESPISEERMKQASQSAKDAVKRLEDFEGVLKGIGEAARKVSAPLQVGAQALHAAQELGKEFDAGATAMDQFRNHVRLLREAADGPFKNVSAFGAVGGMAVLQGNPGNVISQAMLQFGLFKDFQKLQGAIGSPSEKFTPAMMKGSREAQETIARSNEKALSVEEQVLQTLRMGNAIHEQQAKYAKQVADILTNNKEAAGLAKGLGFGAN